MTLAEIFYARHPRRLHDHERRRPRARRRPGRVHFEPLEGRLLLSATLSGLGDAVEPDFGLESALVVALEAAPPAPAGAEDASDIAGGSLTAPSAGSIDMAPAGSGEVASPSAVSTAAFPVPLQSPWVFPSGSLVREGYADAWFEAAGDVAAFSLDLDGGQTVTLAVTPLEGWEGADPPLGQVELLGPDARVLGTATAAVAGGPAILQTVSVAESGTYVIRLTHVAGGNGIGYSLRLLLNAAVEVEQLTGAPNDSAGTAQAIAASAVALEAGADRLAVDGAAEGPLTPDFYAFDLFAGQAASLALTDSEWDASGVTLELLDGAGATLTAGVADSGAVVSFDSAPVDQAITGFVAPAAGTYYARVTGSPGLEYSLVVTRGAAFELRANDGTTSAQDLTGIGQVLGHVGGVFQRITAEYEPNDDGLAGASRADLARAIPLAGSFSRVFSTNTYRASMSGTISAGQDADWDFFKIFASPGDTLSLTLSRSGGTMLPVVRLFDNTPVELASASAGISASLVFSDFRYTGDYYIVADSQGESQGRYALSARLTTTSLISRDVDVYRVEALPGDHLVVATTTPGGGPGEPVNTLDPTLELLDPSGARIASDDNSAADGRNGLITHDVVAAGTYRVRVTAASNAGEYTLRVEGATGEVAEPFTVTRSSLADGVAVTAFPATLNIELSAPVLLTSLSAGDLTVNGAPASGVTVVDGRTLRFDLAGLATGDGTYDVRLAAGALTDIRGRASVGFALGFTLDGTGPTVIASSIASGDVLAPGPLTFTATFSEDLATAGLDAADVTLAKRYSDTRIAPASFTYDPASRQLAVEFPGLDDGAWRLTLASGATGFRDPLGNPLNGAPGFPLPSGQGHPAGDDFAVDFSVDMTAGAYPVPLEPKPPGGSLIYDPDVEGAFYAAGDTDALTLALDPGQTVTVVLEPLDPSLRARVDVFDPSGALLASGESSAAGAVALVQAAPVATAGTYRIEATGLAGTGGYALRALLNAAAEVEMLGGAANDSRAAAEDIEASFIALGSGAARGAVVGELLALGASPAPQQDWYRFSLVAGQAATLAVTLQDREAQGSLQVELYDASGTRLALGVADAQNVNRDIRAFVSPATGAYDAVVRGDARGEYSLVITRGADFDLEPNSNRATAQDAGIARNVLGALGDRDSRTRAIRVAVHAGDYGGLVAAQLNDDTYFDFQATPVQGSQIDTLAELWDYDVVVIADYTLEDLDSFAPALRAWVEGGGGVVGTGWLIYAAGESSGPPVPDIDAIIPIDTAAPANYDLYDPLITITDASHPVTAGLTDFQPGTYVEYSNGAVDAGARVLALAGTIPAVVVATPGGAGRSVWLGPSYIFYDEGQRTGAPDRLLEQAVAWAGQQDPGDHYLVPARDGDALVITTATPGDGGGEPVNTLDPRLELYDPVGSLVASDDGGAGDGRNARIDYTIPGGAGGAYVVAVRRSGGSGEYVLAVSGASGGPDAPPFVTATTPVDGLATRALPDALVVTLSEAVRVDSVEASDLAIDGGVTVTAVEMVDGRTVRFALSVPDASAAYRYSLAAGAFVDLQGTPSLAHEGGFVVDRTSPRVVAQAPAAQASIPFGQITVIFDEALDPASVSVADVVSFTGPDGADLRGQIWGVSVSGRDVAVSFNGQYARGPYTMVLGPEVADLVGNPMDQDADGVAGEPGEDAFTAAVSVAAPDLTVESLVVPARAEFGQTIDLSFTVRNVGDDPAAQGWSDGVWLSTDATLSGDDRWLAIPPAPTVPLGAGETYTQAIHVTLPLDATVASGEHFVIVQTDSYGQQPESDETNNLAVQPISVALPPLPDLVVSDVQAPLETISGQEIPIAWTLTNQGTAAISGSWVDVVYLGRDPASVEWVFGAFTFTGTLGAGESVTRVQTAALPIVMSGDWWVTVQTDAYNQVFEHAREDNNTTVDDRPIAVRLMSFPNLQVTGVTPPAGAFSGQPTEVRWQVTNTGTGATSAPAWYDTVYLSLDHQLGEGDTFLGAQWNPSYLNPGESYASALTVTLPRGIDGDYVFLVQTDAANHVFELDGEADNLGAGGPSRVTLTPPPDLRVSVDAPAQAFSGQPMTVSWTVTNEGPGRTLETVWWDQLFMSADEVIDGSDRGFPQAFHVGGLGPGESYPVTQAVTLPIGVTGDFFFLVRADANNDVFEHAFEANNDGRDAAPTTIILTPPPDLEVPEVTVPATALAGHALEISYRVANLGATFTPNAYWTDTVYLSTDPVLDGGDMVLSDVGHWGSLEADEAYTSRPSFVLPYTLAGTYYAIVVADRGDVVFEVDNANNAGVSAQAITIEPAPADLQVSSASAPATGEAGAAIRVDWTVTNAGSGDTIATAWLDRVILSTGAGPFRGDDIVLLEVWRSGLLDPGQFYSVSQQVALPFTLIGDFHVFVVTDATAQVVEPAGEANNVGAAGTITITRRTPDLQVAGVTAPAEAQAGTLVPIEWTVVNLGVNRTNSTYWYDALFVSEDATLGPDDRFLGHARRSNALDPGESYSATASPALPRDLAAGTYHVLVRADDANHVLEDPWEGNNVGASVAIAVSAAEPLTPETPERPIPPEIVPMLVPDLVPVGVDAPVEAISGQAFAVTWTVRNDADPTGDRTWYDAVYLSRDQVFDPGTDVYVGYRDQLGGLFTGRSYTATQAFTIPRGLSGPFYVFVAVDRGNSIPGERSELNNIGRDPLAMLLTLAAPADLVVGEITVPADATVGRLATIQYSVENQGVNAALGSWYDSISFSTDDRWDVADALFGRVLHVGNVAGGGSYSEAITAVLPGIASGSYRVIVRSDILNHVPEGTETNNAAASLDLVAIDADRLIPGVPATGALIPGQAAFYRLDVGVGGETLRLAVDSVSDAASMELYVRFGAMPTRGEFDVAATLPFMQHQELVVPTTEAGTYYVLVYEGPVSRAGEYSLLAETVPFSVRRVDPGRAGNAGDATLAIHGARFTPATRFELVSPDSEVVEARRVFLQDASLAYVTFGFFARPTGLYDVRAIQADGTTARLDDAATIVTGEGADVALAITGPSQVRPGQLNLFTLNYANAGDADTLAPLLLVESSTGTPVGTSPDATEARALHLVGASLDGPMDVFRPGARYALPLFYRSTTATIDIRVRPITTDDTTPIDDWRAIETAVRPSSIPDAEWEAFWGRIQPGIGPTWGDWVGLLDRLVVLLSEPGHPIRDVRKLFERLHAVDPTFRPASIVSGRLLDATTGEPIADEIVAAYRVQDRGLTLLGGATVTDATGAFSLAVVPGSYVLALQTRNFDVDRDGFADFDPPRYTVVQDADTTGVTLYAEHPVEAPAHVTDSEPVLAIGPDGTPHIIWDRDGLVWHASFDGTGWVGATPISDASGRHLRLAAAGNLLDGTGAGLVATWVQGDDNEAEIYYAVGRAAAGGGFEWSDPVRLTNDTVEDSAPALAVNATGQAVIVHLKENADVQDDPDLYYDLIDIRSGEVIWSSVESLLVGGDLLPEDQAAGLSVSKVFGPYKALGIEVKASIGFTGGVSLSGCSVTATVGGKANASFEGPSLAAAIEGQGSITGNWVADVASRDWKFVEAIGNWGIKGSFDWKNGLLKLLGLVPALKPVSVAVEKGLEKLAQWTGLAIENKIGFEVGFTFNSLRWTTQPPFRNFPLPERVDKAFINMALGPKLGAKDPGGDFEFEVGGTLDFGAKIIPVWDVVTASATFAIKVVIHSVWDFEIGRTFSLPNLAEESPETAEAPLGVLQEGVPEGWTFTVNPAGALGTGNVYGPNSLFANVNNDRSKDGAPALGRESDGDVFAAWSKDADPSQRLGSVVLVSDLAGSTWTAPTEIPGSLGLNNYVRAIVDGSGKRLAVWSRADASSLSLTTSYEELQAVRAATEVVYSVFENGAWSAPVAVAATPGRDGAVTLGTTPDGRVALAWISRDATEQFHLLVAFWNGTAWTAPQEIAVGSAIGNVALGRIGEQTLAFWSQDVNADPDVTAESLFSSAFDGTAWSTASLFAPVLVAGSIADPATDVPELRAESHPYLPPVPEECLNCKPEEIKRIQAAAPT